jgi:hypothetical protein
MQAKAKGKQRQKTQRQAEAKDATFARCLTKARKAKGNATFAFLCF